ncbi:MAG: class B sortase [Clostridiales bacterium]|nr:class B sortase [Clostridiales bacterium]
MITNVDIQVLSVKNKSLNIAQRRDEIAQTLGKYGFSLTDVNKTALSSKALKQLLNKSAGSQQKPDTVIIAEALTTTDSKSFRKSFAEVVASAQRAENDPTPKKYWKNRNAAFKQAKKDGASEKELSELEDEYRLYRRKSKIFNLGDFGNSYKGYCFMYKGMRVAVLPKSGLTDADLTDELALAAVRTEEVFENSAEDYPDGFSTVEYVPEKTGFVNRFIPIKGDSKKEVARKCVVIFSFLVFLAALALLFYNMVYLSLKNAELNGEIQTIAHGTDDGGDQSPDVDDEIDWDKLKAINEEIVGWIQINDTQIDYPVLWHQADSSTSQYYLTHNYKGNYDAYGSIFLDYRCTEGTNSKNIVIHGHHMNDGSMFGDLMNYGGTTGNLDFYQESPTIEFDTPEGNADYKIISVFKTNTLSSQGEFFNYMVGNFNSDQDFMDYVYNVRIRSLINCPVDVNEDDELITLSTCSYEFTNFRTVIVARKVRDGESSKVNVSDASLNKNAVWPNVYYSAYGGTRPTVTDFCTAYEDGEIDWYDGDYEEFEENIEETTSASSSTGSSGGSSSSSGSSSKSSSSKASSNQATVQTKVYYTVTFINYDGSTISTQKVEAGKAATAPEDPTKPSDEYYDYVFKGWGLDFSNVTCSMTIAPEFEGVLKTDS